MPAEVARPLLPATLLMVATEVTDEPQVADAVRSRIVLSEKVPVTPNCCVVPKAILGLAGVTARETSVFGVEPPHRRLAATAATGDQHENEQGE